MKSYDGYAEKKRKLLQNDVAGNLSFKSAQLKFDQNLIEWVLETGVPLYIVDKKSFRAMINGKFVNYIFISKVKNKFITIQ